MEKKKRAAIYRRIALFMGEGYRTNKRCITNNDEYKFGICMAYRLVTGDEKQYTYSFTRLIENMLPELELVNEPINIDSCYFLKATSADRQNICLLMAEMVTNPIYDDGILGDD